VRAARATLQEAQSREALAKAERWIDVDVGLGFIHTTAGTEDWTAPPFEAIALTLSVPIPISLANRGSLRQAQAEVEKAAREVDAAEAALEAALREASARYAVAQRRVALFSDTIVRQAERVRENKLFSYQHGDTSLLEELNAERTLDEVHLEQIDVKRENAHALMILLQLAGKALVLETQ
jgi:cobalt-zinc-cadmium efflux system outer membrane protein